MGRPGRIPPRPRGGGGGLALRASSATWSDLRDASLSRHADSVAAFGTLYERVMRAYGRRVRPPLTIDHFATAMAALGEGFALQSIQGILHPHVRRETGPGVGADWTVFGLGVWALIDTYTEPDDERGGDAAVHPGTDVGWATDGDVTDSCRP